MARQISNAAIDGAATDISYYLQSRLMDLARLIENAAQQPLPDGGPCAIFSGGEEADITAAVRLLTDALGAGWQQLDLVSLYAKYQGESENHLAQILEEARDRHQLVLCDGVDALFGHSHGGDESHEHHARLDVAYFLNILRRFNVPVILRTRAYYRLDHAIIKHFSCVIDFDDGILPLVHKRSAPHPATAVSSDS